MAKTYGLYKIENMANGKVFVDDSADIDHEWSKLKDKLNSGQFNNSRLQNDWHDYGESGFEFEVIEEYRGGVSNRNAYLKDAKASLVKEYNSSSKQHGYNVNLDVDTVKAESKQKWIINVNINEYIDRVYLSRLDQGVETASGRLDVVSDIEHDDVIVDYVSSAGYRSKQAKLSKDFLAERDITMRRFEKVANYLIYPERDAYNILSKNQLSNLGRRKPDAKGYRKPFLRVLPFTALIRYMNLSDSDDSNSDGEFGFTRKTYNFMNSDNETFTERMLLGIEPDVEVRYQVDFSDPVHVLHMLKMYDRIKEKLVEEQNEVSIIWTLLSVLDDLINKVKYSDVEQYMIGLLKSGERTRYRDVMDTVRDKYNVVYTYNQVEYMMREGIPKRIVKRYNKVKDKYTM